MTVQEWLGKDNTLGIDIWEKKYKYNGESFDQWLDRVSGGDEELREYIKDKKFMFGGRITANRGTNKNATMMNCYTRGFVGDSLAEIMKANTDIAMTFKAQGGQGLSLSKIRPKGTGINHGQFKSDGIIPFMEIFNKTTESVSQGGSRKGALLMSLDAWHKEAKDFITIKSDQNKIQKANLSLEIDDEFMEDVEKYYKTGEVVKKHIVRDYGGNRVEYDVCPIEVYKLMMQQAWESGEPGCILSRRFRNYNLMEYCNDYNIETCNPSLRAGTKVLTDRGIINIEQLVGEKFKVQTINGDMADAECFLSGHDKPLYKVELENGTIYYATKEHKWPVLNNGRYTKTFTEDLQAGDYLPYTKNKYLPFGHKGDYSDGFFIGYWYGDGSVTVRKDDGRYQYNFTFGKEKADVGLLDKVVDKLSLITGKEIHYYTRNRGGEDWYEICCGDKKLHDYMFDFGVYESKHVLPEKIYSDLSEDFRKGFIDGLFSTDGTVDLSEKSEGIKLTTASKDFSKSISDFLWWYGIRNNIQYRVLTLNGKKFDSYNVQMSKRPSNVFSNVFHLSHRHKQEKIDKLPDSKRIRKDQENIMIKSVELTNIHEDVYDIHVYDDSHTFRINCCVTGNCGEQPLAKNAACDLGSINLAKFVVNEFEPDARFDFESFGKVIDCGVRSLDLIIDENEKNHALEEQRLQSKNYRNIGLGVMGLYDCLVEMNMTYGSQESIRFIDSLFGYMFRRAVIASSKLASEKGAFPNYSDNVLKSKIIRKHFTDDDLNILGIRKNGLRNCSLLSIAPTGSIGTMFNIGTGCEPAFMLSFKRKTESLKGKDEYYTVYMDVAQRYKDSHKGSDLPDTFVTSQNINWKDRINVQAAIQEHVDTGISSTVNLPNKITVEEVEQLYLYAWEKGLKGVTIFRDGCKRAGILTTGDKKEDDNKVTMQDIPRGVIIKADDNCIGKKRTLHTGCGSLHIQAFFDPDTGDLLETFFSRGSSGGCTNSYTGLSRMISLSARAGVDIYSIVDQLKSSGVCPSYAVRGATKHDTSRGSSCPVAIGNALLEMYNEVKEDIGIDEPVQKKAVKIESKPITKKLFKNDQDAIDNGCCPQCGSALIRTGGCINCIDCGWTKCD